MSGRPLRTLALVLGVALASVLLVAPPASAQKKSKRTGCSIVSIA